MERLNRFLLICLVQFYCLSSAIAQVQTPRYVAMISNAKAYYEYLPQGYDSSGKNYPLLLCIGGIGNWGDGSPNMLPLAIKSGPSALIKAGHFPNSFVVNCQRFRFIVITPQFVEDPTPSDVDSVLDYIVSHYRVDKSRIYLTGWSWGGGLVWNYAGSNSKYANRIAAIVPISGARQLDILNCRIITAANLPVWATHNDGDTVVPVKYTINNVNYINLAPAPTPMAKMTIFPNRKFHNAWAKTYAPWFKEDGLNIYQWMLQYQRGGVPSPGEITIKAYADANRTITLPTDSVSLKGWGKDRSSSIASYKWSKISGPSGGDFEKDTSPRTKIYHLTKGVYFFELTVTDTCGFKASDTVKITVKPIHNKAPGANAGTDQTITLPVNTVTLTGSGTDADGTIATYRWSKISGPWKGKITNSTSAQTTVTGLVEGTYRFKLKVTDDKGASGSDTVTIIVNPAQNIPPKANAGKDKTIKLPIDSVKLKGKGTDSDGKIASYQWSQVSGPGTSTFSNGTAAQTEVYGLTEGVYLFEFKVTDNKGLSATDTVQVTVKPVGNEKPKANAGPDKTIILPVNSVTLVGSGTDEDGTIVSYRWNQISGPAKATISDSAAAQITVSGLIKGSYLFKLKVSDNKGATGKDTVEVIVSATPNTPPIVNAGTDLTITLPVDSVTLNGSATDLDGTIAYYQWTEISGPANATIANPDSATTTTTGLVEGIYLFQLKATDNSGDAAADTIKVTVNAVVPIPIPSNATKYIKVNVYGGTNPYNNNEWNNWDVGTSEATNISTETLRYADGTSSGISALLSHSQTVGDNGATYGSGMAPAEVLRYTSYSAKSRTLTIQGLSKSKKYTIELYASRYDVGNSTIFTIDTLSQTIATYNNYTHKALFANVLPNAQGQIVITLTNGFNYNNLNGFIITEQALDSTGGPDNAQTTKPTSFRIYPNPVHDQFMFELNSNYNDVVRIQLFSMLGSKVKDIEVTKDKVLYKQSISLDNLPAGHYIIAVQLGGWKDAKIITKL